MKKLLLFSIIATILTSCSFYKEVEVTEVKDVKITRFDQDIVEAEVTLEIKNPNWYAVSLTESFVDVYINGKEIGEVELKEKIKLPKKTTNVRTLVMVGDYEKMSSGFLDNLLTLLFANQAKFEAKGYMKGRALLVTKKVDVNVEEFVDLRNMK
jgi:LEA14-like dessication related protein